MLASLAGVERIARFCGISILKGFSTLLFPTDFENGCIVWHLIYNEDGSRISFADNRIPIPSKESLIARLRAEDVERARHIVGWATKLKKNTGADGANYDIGWSGLSTAIQGADLERLQITAGKLITVGATFSRGKREKPVHIKFEDDYGERLDYLSEQLIVLHDTEVRIAWLVDGLSALLHLVKANLRYRHRKQPQINSGTTPSPELNKFRTADGSSGQQMALETLENTRNLTIPLRRKAVAAAGTENSEEDAPFYCVKDLVKYIMHALEQIIDKEADERADSDATWHLRGPRAFGTLAQKQVVGYDFMAIAAKRHPFHPVGATIQSGGGDWAEVIRQIHAPILFGKQFGELMEPIRNNEHGGCCEKCSWNINVPPHRDILAVAMSELDAIIERGGRKLDNRWCLVQKFYFDFSPELFVRCEKNKRGQCHQQRIQGG